MEIPPSDPTAKLRLGESALSTGSTPIAATPTTISFQLDAEADAELYGQDEDSGATNRSIAEPVPSLSTTITEKPSLESSEVRASSISSIPGLFLISDPLSPSHSPQPSTMGGDVLPAVDSWPILKIEEDASEKSFIPELITEQDTFEKSLDEKLAAEDFLFAVQDQTPQKMAIDKVTVKPEPEALDTDMTDSVEEEKRKGTADMMEKMEEEEEEGTAGAREEMEAEGEEGTTGMIEKVSPQKDPLDPDFIAAGEANKNIAEAEWQLDSSTSDSTSESSEDSELDSGAGSDDDYPLMDHEQLARLLMSEDCGDDEESRKEGFQGPLKTKNEIPEEAVPIPRPSIAITPEMKIELLGAIETIVGTMVLIKAFVSGDHQVLNEGSLLCFEDRTIVGVVSDTFGRVEEPLYTVRFNAPEEISETGASVGQKVFYVPQHSDYVFTQALKGIKGSDASNIFDEEVGEAEREFSDDEAEAEYKRQRKYARAAQAGGVRGGRGRGGAGGGNGAVRNQTPTIRETEELYTPLTRPANLAELMDGPPPLPPMNNHSGGGNRGDRGHHRGSRNDRGGKNRGRGGQKGGRGRDNHEFRKRDRDGDQVRGDYQDREERPSQSPYQQRHQNYSQQSGESQSTHSSPPYQQRGYQSSQYQQPPQKPPHQFQNQQFQPYQQQQQQWSPPSNLPQFPQFPAYQQQQQPPYQQYPPQSQPNFYPSNQTGSPGNQFPTLPQGAHVNPAFFRGGPQQQQQQSMPAPPARNDFNWSLPALQGGQEQQNSEAAFKALQNLVSMSNQMRNSPNAPSHPPQ